MAMNCRRHQGRTGYGLPSEMVLIAILALTALAPCSSWAEHPYPPELTLSQVVLQPASSPPPAATREKEPGAAGTFWSWLWNYLTDGASLTAGIGTRMADLRVTDKATGATGTIAQRDEEAYFVSYSTRPSFVRDTRFGYTFLFNYTTFNMDRQKVADNVYEDLGTRVRGRVAYIVPTVFYQLGEHGPRGAYVRLGAGAGLGVAKYEGTIILGYPHSTTATPISNGNYGLKFAASLLLEARYRSWGVTLNAAGPSYEDRQYRYNLTDLSSFINFTVYF
jgi:hypothetical protein